MRSIQTNDGVLPALALALTLATAACNAITGVGELRIEDEDEDGSGGAAAGAGASGVTASVAQAATTSVSGGGTTAATTSGATSCTEYPSGSYGITAGKVLDPSLSWSVFPPGGNQLVPMSPADFYDCDGARGIHALLIIGGSSSCGACQAEANALPSHHASFTAKGIVVVYLMLDGSASQWRDYFDLDQIHVGNDPNYGLLVPGSNGTPINLIVDPRDMSIVARTNGFSNDFSQLEALATQNGG